MPRFTKAQVEALEKQAYDKGRYHGQTETESQAFGKGVRAERTAVLNLLRQHRVDGVSIDALIELIEWGRHKVGRLHARSQQQSKPSSAESGG